MKRRSIHQNEHPFDVYPFEAFRNGSWQPVERIRIQHGTFAMHVLDEGDLIEEEILISNVRIRSRNATSSDCACFLRPGLDISVFSTPHQSEDSDEENDGDEKMEPEPAWIDAKIRSIERKPHGFGCGCQFHISVYVTQGPPPIVKKTLSKEIKVVQLNQIAILQKIEQKPCEDKYYRWSLSDDCSTLQKFKLFTGKFCSDLSWLLVASAHKQVTFDVRSVHNRIVYEILKDENDIDATNSEFHSYAVNFKLENEVSTPIIVQFNPDIPERGPEGDVYEAGPLVVYDELRRSKRRFVQPERYLGCDDYLTEFDVEMTRLVGGKMYKSELEELPMALSIQADHAYQNGDIDKTLACYQQELRDNSLLSRNRNRSDAHTERKRVSGDKTSRQPHLAMVPLQLSAENNLFDQKENPLSFEDNEDLSAEIREIVSKYIYVNGSSAVEMKKSSLNLMQGRRWGQVKVSKLKFMGLDVRGGGIGSSKKARKKRNCHPSEQPPIIDQWKEFQNTKSCQREPIEKASTNNEEELSELDMLWKEMELALASCYLLDDTEDTNLKSATELHMATKKGTRVCHHDFRLNEEIGIVCRLCGVVSTEIKDVPPPFMPATCSGSGKEHRPEEVVMESKQGDDADLDHFTIPVSSNKPSSEGEVEDNVWALIPDLRNKLRAHQRRAFEFLWKNIAGSIIPTQIDPESKKRGGCVISHTPGAGKTLLIIAFLVSYLKLFPGSRPLVLAPKTTLYTWYKEIIKWKIPIPVYQIHGGQTYKGEVLRQKMKLCPGLPRNQDVMHVLDCLEKMQKWLAHPSVLLMGYTSFLTLTREDSTYAHRKYMNQVLRQCPGILILDEGHNPRSTKSRLRKALMKVNTSLRILLSGTLFQNNFGEYFNTLCLARPRFVDEVLKELDPKYKKRVKGAKTRFSLENRARKMFIDKISKKIDSNKQRERKEGLNILKKLTTGFIDVYEGGSSDNLPGLQCYTLMMKSTTLQQEILVKLQDQRPIYKGFPLELELLITLGAIHPWLIRTTACSGQYFKEEELEALEKFKFDLKLGSKVKFVMSLIPRCLLRKEKVLIFCHNIAPINLFLEIFERFYGWRKGIEVLVLQGDIELFERAEGISLTAASRVILLDSEWNPSKSKQAIARAFRPGQDKVVYVYQLLATGTLEEEKYKRTTWKEWVSSMIFSEDLVEDPSHWQAPKIEDELLGEIVEEDRATLFHMIMKNEKASNMGRLQV
nr:SNF2 domain-containing protein CLASSY 1-like [Ipomoea batatas]